MHTSNPHHNVISRDIFEGFAWDFQVTYLLSDQGHLHVTVRARNINGDGRCEFGSTSSSAG